MQKKNLQIDICEANKSLDKYKRSKNSIKNEKSKNEAVKYNADHQVLVEIN
jgi:hypothetical protein